MAFLNGDGVRHLWKRVKGALDDLIDATLTEEGQAADAKATGEAISQLKEDIEEFGIFLSGTKPKINYDSKNKTVVVSGLINGLYTNKKYISARIDGTTNPLIFDVSANDIKYVFFDKIDRTINCRNLGYNTNVSNSEVALCLIYNENIYNSFCDNVYIDNKPTSRTPILRDIISSKLSGITYNGQLVPVTDGIANIQGRNDDNVYIGYTGNNLKINISSADKKVSFTNIGGLVNVNYGYFLIKSSDNTVLPLSESSNLQNVIYYDLIEGRVKCEPIANGEKISNAIIFGYYYSNALYNIYYDDITIDNKPTSRTPILRDIISSKLSGITYNGQLVPVTDGIANIQGRNDDNSLYLSAYKIFRKVVCCGDSYTSGHVKLSDSDIISTNENYAWPHYMELKTGNKWYNCGCSGCTVLTWLIHERGLPAAKKIGKSQAYVIGLGINDSFHVEVGSPEDIGTDNQTYYGGMSKIIKELNAISPDAFIFLNTWPDAPANSPYNEAIRYIAQMYKENYHTHCIDLEQYKTLYKNDLLRADYIGGHYTAIGYSIFAELYAHILSTYIMDNISYFQAVHKIPFDE